MAAPPESRCPIDHYIVAGNRPWNRQVFFELLASREGVWTFVSNPAELEHELATEPRYVFFLHWSWIVPGRIVERFECVNFHMTDLPYGRGGSPLQNLIADGNANTVLTAIRMTDEVDAGPVYGKRPLNLQGSAQEIYERSSRLAAEMIAHIVETRPKPIPQVGDVVEFKRRTPGESAITSELSSVSDLYDHIRMLDADTYPHAFLEHAGFRFEFRNAAIQQDGSLAAAVRVTRANGEDTL